MTKQIIGFIGTGLMGAPMVRNLLAAGYVVRVWNRSSEKAEALVGDGAILCVSPQAVVTGAGIVITMLSDGTATGSIMADRNVTGALKAGAIWIDMSSIKPSEARAQRKRLTEFSVLHLDAPVSCGTKGAEAGTLAIMVGGDGDVFEAAVPVMQVMGQPVHVGPSGAGQLAKLANQAIVAVTIGAVAEAMLLLEKGGADPTAVRRALKGGFADSTILQQHGARMTERNFVPGGLSKFQVKDLNNMLQEAGALGLDMPVTQHIRDRFAFFCTEMQGSDLDHSGLYLELLQRNGLEDNKQ